MNGKHMTRSRGATRLYKEYHINTIVSLFPRPSTYRLLNLKPEREDTKILLYLREFFFFFSFSHEKGQRTINVVTNTLI